MLLVISMGSCLFSNEVQASTQPEPISLEQTSIQFKNQAFNVEIADTPSKQMTGLMHIKKLKKGVSGMLFIFPKSAIQCFWMKNTHLALSAIFITYKGQITQIERMRPQTHTSHCSREKVTYVLEVESDFEKHLAFKKGQYIQFLNHPQTTTQSNKM